MAFPVPAIRLGLRPASGITVGTYDTFDEYAQGALLDAQAGGHGFASDWVSRFGAFGLQAWDVFNYDQGAALDGKALGAGFDSAWVSRDGAFGVQAQDAIDYGDGEDLDGQSGGSGFTSDWVSR
jgi:hypothetical protein